MIRDATSVIPTPTATPPRSALPDLAPNPKPVSPPVANPRLRIEAALNLVVIEFRDEAGEISRSIPSPRELDAYRSGAEAEPPPPAALDVTR